MYLLATLISSRLCGKVRILQNRKKTKTIINGCLVSTCSMHSSCRLEVPVFRNCMQNNYHHKFRAKLFVLIVIHIIFIIHQLLPIQVTIHNRFLCQFKFIVCSQDNSDNFPITVVAGQGLKNQIICLHQLDRPEGLDCNSRSWLSSDLQAQTA